MGGPSFVPSSLDPQFDNTEDQLLFERLKQLRTTPIPNQQVQSTIRISGEELDRQFNERLGKLTGRMPHGDNGKSIIDVEELTEEDQIDRILNEVHDEVRLEMVNPQHRKANKKESKGNGHTYSSDSESEHSGSDSDSDDSYTDSDSDEEQRKKEERRRKERGVKFGERWQMRKTERSQSSSNAQNEFQQRKQRQESDLEERERRYMEEMWKKEREKKEKFKKQFLKNNSKFY